MNRTIATAFLGAVLTVAAFNCTGRSKECTRDSDCPEAAYCHPDLGFCFVVGGEESERDGGVEDGGARDGGTEDGGTVDAGADGGTDSGVVAQPSFCSSSRWCWESPRPTGNPLVALAGAGEEVWAAGWGTLMRFDGKVWTDYAANAPGFVEQFNAMWVGSKTDAWAVGASGLTKHWNGSDWLRVPSGTSTEIFGIFGFSSSQVWAVGAAGMVLSWDGISWNPEQSGTADDLFRIWGTSPNDLWAVGYAGRIVHRTASGWTTVASPTNTDITGICGSAANDLWAVAEEGAILHSNGTTWTKHTQTPRTYWGIACRSSTDVWVSGDGTMLHWDGETWSDVPLDTKSQITSVHFTPGGDGWAVGFDGTLLRWVVASWQIASRHAFSGKTSAAAVVGLSHVLLGTQDGRVITCSNSGSCLEERATDGGAIEDIGSVLMPSPFSPQVYAISGSHLLSVYKSGMLWQGPDLGHPLQALSASSEDGGTADLWVAGRGLVQRCTPDLCDGPSDAGSDVYTSIVGLQNGRALAASTGGLVQCAAGGGCSPVTLPEQVTINSLWSPDRKTAYAACAAGKVVFGEDTSWEVTQLPTTASLESIHGTSASDIWVSSDRGELFHFNGSAWTPFASGTSLPLTTVRAMSPGAAIAIGNGSYLLRYKP